jgi:hypothetical protein
LGWCLYFIAAYEIYLKSVYIHLAEIDIYGKQKPRSRQLGYKWINAKDFNASAEAAQ